MYISITVLSPWLCLISALITYDRESLGITSMLNYSIPANTEKVKFGYNLITHIQAGYFNLPNLTKMELSPNKISNIDDYAFANVSGLTTINLRRNKLTVIRENMFSGLHKLSILRLNGNQIQTVEYGSFKDTIVLQNLALHENSFETIPKCLFVGLPKLKQLHLAKNNIHTIGPGNFKDTKALQKLYLYKNSLETFPRNMFDLTNHPIDLNIFDIYDNPLSCTDSLCWLKQIDTTWITVTSASSAVCSGPEPLIGRTWDTLSTTDLNCGSTLATGQFYVWMC